MRHQCQTQRCRGTVNKNTEKSPYCARCRDRRFKAAHPIKWHYNSLKKHARLRGKPFSLTLEEFTQFAQQTDYVRLVGKSSLSLSIDRIENALGYHIWNIRGVTLRENSRKQWVPFFNQGMTPAQRREYLAAEQSISVPLEAFAQKLTFYTPAGSPVFWRMVKAKKEELMKL